METYFFAIWNIQGRPIRKSLACEQISKFMGITVRAALCKLRVTESVVNVNGPNASSAPGRVHTLSRLSPQSVLFELFLSPGFDTSAPFRCHIYTVLY